jgi:serpin B
MGRVLSVAVGVVSTLVAGCGGDLLDPITALPRQLSVAEQQLIQADNAFAFSLFREINRQEEAGQNVFVSPLSVAMALGMTYNGADGTTRVAMAEALELQGMSINDVNQAYRDLIDLLTGLDGRVEFRIANSIWHRPAFTPSQTFLDLNQQFFDATVQALDFAGPGAAATINGWVDQNTNGKIPKIVPDPLPDQIVMYLINAIYFKGDWTYRFDKDLTRNAPFELAEGGDVSVPMMSREEKHAVRTFGDADVTVVELPYSRRAYAMTVVLPRTATGAASLATELTQERWNGWIVGLDSTSIFVNLPKFTIEYAVRLNDVLKALGMAEAFDPCKADFGNMFPSANPGDFYIDDVRHKTFVEVNEEGTVAAAATSVGIGPTSAPARIEVDRPFLFAIRERLTGSILFMGKIMDPTVNQPREIDSVPEQCQP